MVEGPKLDPRLIESLLIEGRKKLGSIITNELVQRAIAKVLELALKLIGAA